MSHLPNRGGTAVLSQLIDTLRRAVGDAMEAPPGPRPRTESAQPSTNC
jgi:hypothetical protein